MEGLILLLAEVLAVPLFVAATALLDLALLGIDLLVSVASLIVGSGRRRGQSDHRAGRVQEIPAAAEQVVPASVPSRRRFQWRTMLRLVGIGGVSLLALLVIALAVANWLFFDGVVRWQLARAQRKTGIAVTFDAADGSLWTGEVDLHGVNIERSVDDVSNFALSARRLAIDLAVLDLLRLKPVFEQVEIQGLRGTYDRVGLPETLQPRRSFRLGRLAVNDAVVQVTDRTRPNNVRARVQIDSLTVEPLRSDWAVFDLLFRGNAAARIDGREFSIATREIPAGRETRWRGMGLPVELLAAYVGGPLDWIKTGALDVDVTDRWQVGQEAQIDMHWQLVLRDIRAEIPDDASRATCVVAKPAVAFLNKHAIRLPLEFEVVIDRDRFHLAASPDAAGLGRAVGDALAAELGRLAEIKPEAIKQAAAEQWSRFKEFLDKRRQPPAP